MAGYLFSMNSKDALENCIKTGVYSTNLSAPINGRWKIHHEGVFADFCSMKEGDNIYFFYKRKIYGIGKLININGQCKYLNYPNAGEPTNIDYQDIQKSLLYDEGEDSVNLRFICFFEPLPRFFEDGVDMDEALLSSPLSFKILRAFWKLSFIKFSDTENQALKNILLRNNTNYDGNFRPNELVEPNHWEHHNRISFLTVNNHEYDFNISSFLGTTCNPNGSISHEMAIEAALIYQLSIEEQNTIDIFGHWDYLSHQVIASPFKPVDYMDKMDVFGYRYINGYKPTIQDYLVVEIKKDRVKEEDIVQLMKYVDWIRTEYSYGDYQMIRAFMLGFEYEEAALRKFTDLVSRKYIKGVRPAIPMIWDDVRLVEYKYNDETKLLDFKDITYNDL